MKKTNIFAMIAATLLCTSAWTKLPPTPPPDPAAAAAKAEKDKATSEKTRADQARYEEKAVKNFQAKMKKAGKPIPKPTPIVVAAAPAPAAAPAAPAKGGASPPKK